MNVLITGGAGFIGHTLAIGLKKLRPDWKIACLDNLSRKGSEINLQELRRVGGITFFQADLAVPSTLQEFENSPWGQKLDVIIHAAADPSVHSGFQNSWPFWSTNVVGTIQCAEWAKKHQATVIDLSTSRVYSIEALQQLPLKVKGTRLVRSDGISVGSDSEGEGINENFSVTSPRSFYGTSKLASEMILKEYAHYHNFKVIFNRLGVVAGPRQWGRADQGVFTLWVAAHHFHHQQQHKNQGKSQNQIKLNYHGYQAKGYQVRDILHPEDLLDLIMIQLSQPEIFQGQIFNIGGGEKNACSLLEWTHLCQKVTGQKIPIGEVKETSPVDIPYYVSDMREIQQKTSWRPQRGLEKIAEDIFHWIKQDEETIFPLFFPS